MLGNDSKKKRQSAALGGAPETASGFSYMTDLKNGNHSIHSDVLGIHGTRLDHAAVTALSSQGLNTMQVYFLLL